MTDVKLEDAERAVSNLERIKRECDDWLGMERQIQIWNAAALLRKIPELLETKRRLEDALCKAQAELEAERTRAHNLAEYIRERV